MSRDRFSYSHGDTGNKPATSLNFESNERPQSEHFDWWWYSVIQAINNHADEFDRLDSDGDGVVDKADSAIDADASTYKGNDIDTDGDGAVNAADYADNADKVDGYHWSDIKDWVNDNTADEPHGNEDHNPDFATVTELDGKADDPHGNEAHVNGFESNIRPSISDDGAEINAGPTDINCGSKVEATADGDGTVTVDALTIDPGLPSNESSNRTPGKWEQNTTGRPLHVDFTASADSSEDFDASYHVNDSKTDNSLGRIHYNYNSGDGYASFSFIVPDQAYYKVTGTDISGDVGGFCWVEQEL
jgi:hypothetical protein